MIITYFYLTRLESTRRFNTRRIAQRDRLTYAIIIIIIIIIVIIIDGAFSINTRLGPVGVVGPICGVGSSYNLQPAPK